MPVEAIHPGATAFTRTPLGAHSTAAVPVRFTMPARAAPECPMPGMLPHMSATTFTIAPPWSVIHCRKHSRENRKPPPKLLRTTASQPLPLIAASGAAN